MPPVNLNRVDLEALPDSPEAFGGRDADLAPALGAEHLAGSVIEIAPGRHAWPYHWEAAQEEWLLVLAGTPTVRTPQEREVLWPGDLVCFPAGPDGAHQITNGTDAPCRVLMLSNREPINVVVYPDSGKVGVRTPWRHGTFPEAAAVDYWEGE